MQNCSIVHMVMYLISFIHYNVFVICLLKLKVAKCRM